MESLKPESSHPKIKPILIQRFASGKNKNENNIQKYSIYTTREFNPRSLPNKLFTKTLVSQHSLFKLEYYFQPQFFPRDAGLPTPVTSFFSQIKNLQFLTTFNLKISPQSSWFQTQTCLKPLLMSLASLKNLSNFNIMFISYLPNLKFLNMLFKYLQRIKTLTNVSIIFWISYGLSTSHLNVFSSGLRKLLQLRSLELRFDKPSELHKYTITQLALTLPKLPFLTKINIRFREDSITPDTILNLFTGLKDMKALSDLSLAIGDRSIEPISQGLSLLDPCRIQKLRLQLNQYFENNSLIRFSEALKKFTSLQALQFGLYVHHLITPEEGLNALISTLSSLTSLSSLTIHMDSANWKRFIEGISVPFKYLKNLTTVNLQITGYTYPEYNQEIQQLFTNFRFLKSLKYFSLSYPQETVNDKNLETFGESLKEIPSLQNLSLDFSCASLVTNQGVEGLACSIKTLMSLSGLKIWLRRNDNIDNKAIDQIAEILKSLPCLYSVDFNFQLCSNITCFDGLLEALKEAKNIGEVALSLPSSVVKSQEMTWIVERKVVKRLTGALD